MGTAGLTLRPPALAGLVTRILDWEDPAPARLLAAEPAEIVFPLIATFGAPFRIALGEAAPVAIGSFAAGLAAAPVHVATTGPTACVQADLTPEGAARRHGGAVADLAGRMVPLGDLWPGDAGRLQARLAEAPGWEARLAEMERFLIAAMAGRPGLPPEIAAVWCRLGAAGGDLRVEALAREIGWSRTRLSTRFRAASGIAPKSAGRILRLGRAMALARQGVGWAEVAAAAGYSDQAHMGRDFVALAGRSPERWLRAT